MFVWKGTGCHHFAGATLLMLLLLRETLAIDVVFTMG